MSAEIHNIDDLAQAALSNLKRSRAGGTYDGMPPDLTARVDRLEKDVAEIKGDVKKVGLDVAELKGRVATLPTTFQMATWFVSVAIGLIGLTFAIARLMK